MTKICNKCGKEVTEFVKGYRQCKECIKKYKAELYRKKKKEYKKHNQQYYKTNKELFKEWNERYYKSHTDQIKKKTKEYRKNNSEWSKKYMHDYGIEYDKKNPGKHAERWRKRRAKQLGVNEKYTEADRQYTKDLFNNECANCKSKDRLTIDHHKPLEHGHPLTRQNAVLLCLSCNCSKATKLPEEFYTPEKLLLIENKLGLNKKREQGISISPAL